MQITLVDAISKECGRIPKIKALRCATGLGLIEAKRIIDELIDDGVQYTFHFNPEDASKIAVILRDFNDAGVVVTIINNADLGKQNKVDMINNLLDNFTSEDIINEMLKHFSTPFVLKQLTKKSVDEGFYGYASAIINVLDSPPFNN